MEGRRKKNDLVTTILSIQRVLITYSLAFKIPGDIPNRTCQDIEIELAQVLLVVVTPDP